MYDGEYGGVSSNARSHGSNRGFGVHSGSLSGLATQLSNASNDFYTVQTDYTGNSFDAKSDYGEFVADAWQAFDTAWLFEMGSMSDAIAKMSESVAKTNSNYQQNEQAVLQLLNAAVADLETP